MRPGAPRTWDRGPRVGASRLLVTAVTLLAFVFQILVLQTHIHGATQASAVKAPFGGIQTAHRAQPQKLPPDNEPSNCPICQELLHASVFVTPVAVAVPLAIVTTVIDLVVVHAAAPLAGLSHRWQSRAPPV